MFVGLGMKTPARLFQCAIVAYIVAVCILVDRLRVQVKQLSASQQEFVTRREFQEFKSAFSNEKDKP